MPTTATHSPPKELNLGPALFWVLAGAFAFQLAYSLHVCGFLIAVYLWSLFELTRLKSARQASYLGLLIGMLAYAPQMAFMWKIFGPAAIALWLVLAFWLRMFLVLGRACRIRFGTVWAALLMPFLWTGLEYFRSELYYLRFSWLNAGYVFSHNLGLLPMSYIGFYGMGFLIMSAIAALSLLPRRKQLSLGAILLAGLAFISDVPPLGTSPSIWIPGAELRVAGVQMESPGETEVIFHLNQLIKKYPDAQLLVLCEYTFTGPVPESIKAWCKKHQRYLVVGAEDPAAGSNYYDTAFVIGPSGDIVFRQAKCVPIQFFRDGLPARTQALWESPWGKLGFCVCYDLSYTRVTDQLIRLGAQAIIVPTMDVADWGRHQHELHARVAPIRAAEYGVPVFRLASSGISQSVNTFGLEDATAPMPGDGAMLFGKLSLPKSGSLPWDRVIAPLSVGVTCLMIGWLTIAHFCAKKRLSKPSD
jgi:apolipoprotein N-acyltransferase